MTNDISRANIAREDADHIGQAIRQFKHGKIPQMQRPLAELSREGAEALEMAMIDCRRNLLDRADILNQKDVDYESE